MCQRWRRVRGCSVPTDGGRLSGHRLHVVRGQRSLVTSLGPEGLAVREYLDPGLVAASRGTAAMRPEPYR